MINSKKVLSVITTMMSCWGMAPCHMCAMDSEGEEGKICAMDSEGEEGKMMHYISSDLYSIINQTDTSGDETRDNTIINQLATNNLTLDNTIINQLATNNSTLDNTIINQLATNNSTLDNTIINQLATNNSTLQRRNAAEIPLAETEKKAEKKNSIEENFDVLDYEEKTFFDSVFDILHDIAECVNIYYVEETGHFVFIYKCSILEATGKQNPRFCVSDHGFTDLYKGLKETFYRLLKHMLKKLIESSSRNILLHRQGKRVLLSDFDKEYSQAILYSEQIGCEFKEIEEKDCENFLRPTFLRTTNKIRNYVKECIDEQLIAWRDKLNVINVQSEDLMNEILEDLRPSL